MKAILISIQPKWVKKILNGEKTIEIRKTMPKCDLPIDVYIYCTKDKGELYIVKTQFNENGDWNKDFECCKGKVVAKFTLKKIGRIHDFTEGLEETELMDRHQTINYEEELLDKSCLNIQQFYKYGGKYAWHISNLEIFDEPKELSEFYKSNEQMEYINSLWEDYGLPDKDDYDDVILTKAPQSWCYVEDLS